MSKAIQFIALAAAILSLACGDLDSAIENFSSPLDASMPSVDAEHIIQMEDAVAAAIRDGEAEQVAEEALALAAGLFQGSNLPHGSSDAGSSHADESRPEMTPHSNHESLGTPQDRGGRAASDAEDPIGQPLETSEPAELVVDDEDHEGDDDEEEIGRTPQDRTQSSDNAENEDNPSAALGVDDEIAERRPVDGDDENEDRIEDFAEETVLEGDEAFADATDDGAAQPSENREGDGPEEEFDGEHDDAEETEDESCPNSI